MKRLFVTVTASLCLALVPAATADASRVRQCKSFPVKSYLGLNYWAVNVRAYRATCGDAKFIIVQGWADHGGNLPDFPCDVTFGRPIRITCEAERGKTRWMRARIVVR